MSHIPITDGYVLRTDHPVSLCRVPVLVGPDGRALGADDHVTPTMTARQLVQARYPERADRPGLVTVFLMVGRAATGAAVHEASIPRRMTVPRRGR